jgi:hypothetical protein
MKNSVVLTSVLKMLAIAVLVAITATMGTLLFVAVGAVLAWLTPLTLFQSVCVAIGSTVAVSLVAYSVVAGAARRPDYDYEEEDYDEDEEEEDDPDADFDFEKDDEADIGPSTIDMPDEPPRPPKVGRNQPCPCGSGKKYKSCCGR